MFAHGHRLTDSIYTKVIEQIPFGRRHLLRVLREYVEYYNGSRPHQSLDTNSPLLRRVETVGEVCAKPVLVGTQSSESDGGLRPIKCGA